MTGWRCPECSRLFARRGQSHECAPALDLDEYFASGPEWERPVFEAVLAHLESLGPMQVEPVSVGIFIKSGGGFVELRPMTRWTAMWFPMDRVITHPRIVRKPVHSGRRVYHVLNLRSRDDVDGQVCDWLSESYFSLGR